MTWEDLLAINYEIYDSMVVNLETAIHNDPTLASNYYFLGLSHLLLKQPQKAQASWNLGLRNSSTPELFEAELWKILEDESTRQEELKEYQTAFDLRQAMQHRLPNDLKNLLNLFYLYFHLNLLDSNTLQDLNLLEVIKLNIGNEESEDNLVEFMHSFINSTLDIGEKIDFISFCLESITERKEKLLQVILYHTGRFNADEALKILDICKKAVPDDLGTLATYIDLQTRLDAYDLAIDETKKFLDENSHDILKKMVAYHLLLGAYMNDGKNWQISEQTFNTYKAIINEVIALAPKDIPLVSLVFLLLSSFYTPYFVDIPETSRPTQNQVSRLFQENIQQHKSELVQTFNNNHAARKLKPREHKKLRIGFLSTTIRRHSVGWLSRFLFQYINRDTFELYGYLPEYMQGTDFLEQWYVGSMHKVFRSQQEFWGNIFQVADQINKDEIDILIDLESITSGSCCQILALKPAPLQVTWLGWDASGLPAMDYYIADPYVLPDNAQEYYSEKIWRLPQTYLAVDGFEATVGTLSREQLGIPLDGVIYFSSQTNRKRHPETVRLQMQIMKQVPHSYFLIKGYENQEGIKDYFYAMAESEGVAREQLRFLPHAKNEGEHRGNLSIADVVLDTYPYTGATTTMEVLWMGIPLVTRVGEQFVSRNSYAMMMNAGITEGIAWTPEEYVEWGVRFGTEPDLRKEVAWKLRQSRQTSPLWNGRQFTKEMEKALTQMWEIYNG